MKKTLYAPTALAVEKEKSDGLHLMRPTSLRLTAHSRAWLMQPWPRHDLQAGAAFFQCQSRNWIAATITPSELSRTSRPAPMIASRGLASTLFPPSQITPQSSHPAGGGLSGIFGHGGKSDPDSCARSHARRPLFDPDQRRAGSFILIMKAS